MILTVVSWPSSTLCPALFADVAAVPVAAVAVGTIVATVIGRMMKQMILTVVSWPSLTLCPTMIVGVTAVPVPAKIKKKIKNSLIY